MPAPPDALPATSAATQYFRRMERYGWKVDTGTVFGDVRPRLFLYTAQHVMDAVGEERVARFVKDGEQGLSVTLEVVETRDGLVVYLCE